MLNRLARKSRTLLSPFVRSAWDAIPESGAKEKLRVAAHNHGHNSNVQFSYKNGVFTSRVDGIELRTLDHPFSIGDTVHQYQARHSVRSGEVVLDAGAYHGHFSIWLSQAVGNEGRVISVEPDAQNALVFRANLRENPGFDNMVLVTEPLWDQESQIEFCEQGNVASSAFWIPSSYTPVFKSTTTIDKVVQRLSLERVDLIKMDIEGAEINALLGAADTVRRHRPNFTIASYHVVDSTLTRALVEQQLREFGYEVETIFYGTECVTYGTTSSKSRHT